MKVSINTTGIVELDCQTSGMTRIEIDLSQLSLIEKQALVESLSTAVIAIARDIITPDTLNHFNDCPYCSEGKMNPAEDPIKLHMIECNQCGHKVRVF